MQLAHGRIYRCIWYHEPGVLQNQAAAPVLQRPVTTNSAHRCRFPIGPDELVPGQTAEEDLRQHRRTPVVGRSEPALSAAPVMASRHPPRLVLKISHAPEHLGRIPRAKLVPEKLAILWRHDLRLDLAIEVILLQLQAQL